jgi:type II secretory pathway predicted ATPase ExeA
MADAAEKESLVNDKAVPTPSKSMVRGYASNEFVFAVVGHVGSGTTKIATSLAELLNKGSIAGDPFDTEIIKARELIEAWATENRKAIPASEPRNLHTTQQFQDLGDEMRAGGDHAAVANRAIQRIRLIRAQKQKMETHACVAY